ncbi:MAG: ADP-ribosylglycohydrolase family protein [Promethearchaeota archaeon]
MLGAIAGDIIGSIFEYSGADRPDFKIDWDRCFYTDDTVLTVALADYMLHGGDWIDFLKNYTREYPNRGYGLHFFYWANSDSREPYNSWGNGSAMRVSPVGFAYDTLDKVLEEAKNSAKVTHNHPEGIKGAQATAACIFLARTGATKKEIKDHIKKNFSYDLSKPIEQIRKQRPSDISCQSTVPIAIQAFLESRDFEDSIRLSITAHEDADTVACITGGIAQAFYGGVPKEISTKILQMLDSKLLDVTLEFCRKYNCF